MHWLIDDDYTGRIDRSIGVGIVGQDIDDRRSAVCQGCVIIDSRGSLIGSIDADVDRRNIRHGSVIVLHGVGEAVRVARPVVRIGDATGE